MSLLSSIAKAGAGLFTGALKTVTGALGAAGNVVKTTVGAAIGGGVVNVGSKILAAVGGPVGAAVGVGVPLAAAVLTAATSDSSPPAGVNPSKTLASLPGIGGGGGVMPTGGAPRGARGIMSSANSYARRYPQWAMSVGGTTGIAQMIASGQLPAVKRRRGRGISSRDLRSFKRVARLVSHFSRPVHHMRGYKRGASRH